MFCGTGKSYIMANIIASIEYKRVVVLFPVIALVDQFYKYENILKCTR